MTITLWIRRLHRWLSILFTLAVLAATWAAATGQDQTSVLYFLPLAPLMLLLFSGLWLFVLPYVRWRSGANG